MNKCGTGRIEDYSDAKYTKHKLDKKTNDAVRILLEITNNDVLIAITAEGAKIFEPEKQLLEQSNTESKYIVEKTTKYEFYSSMYNNVDQTRSFDVSGGAYCHYYDNSTGRHWYPSGCPK